MKKLVAILLIIAMLVSLGITVGAQEAEVEKKPFYLANWTIGTKEYTNVTYMPFFWSSGAKYRESIRNGELAVCWREVGNVDTIPELAVKLKELFDTFPKGSRYINFSTLITTISECSEVCFFEKVPPMVSKWLDEFFTEYKRIGGELDGMDVDIEYLDIYAHYLEEYYKDDPLFYDWIVKHPAYQEKIRPKLVERGFKFYPNVTEYTPEIYGLHSKTGSAYSVSRSIWDTVMRNYLNDIINESCAPLFKHFPDATLSDYTVKQMQPWIKEVSEGGGVIGAGGLKTNVGNASNENYYSVRPNTNFFKDGNVAVYRTLPGYVGTVYENSHFNRFMYEANLGKTTYLGKGDNRITWWMAHAYYGESRAHTPYYSELLFHLGLLNPEIYHGYILQQDCKTDGQRDAEKYTAALQIVDDCLRQMSEIAGYADRKPIAVERNWNHSFVLSGMYANGRNVWRITPDNTKVSVEEFKVKDTDPTFKIGDETVTFPGGKIIADSEVYDIGTCGYWVETAADVMPVITRAEEYYRNNAGYQETFDAYEAGMEYTYNNVLREGCWEIKKQGAGSAVVIADRADANNKVLEIKGDVSIKNVTTPKNIYAGDSYAEHQAWELTFTLPGGLTSYDVELQLLNVIPEKKTATDKGLKIAGGKVYYDQAGEYVELADVALKPGGKYTLIREMNFTTEGAYTSSYYIYALDGELKGKAENIPTAEIDIPVYGVGFSAKNVNGDALIVDNYRLYPTKVATDFYLYDATLGMKIEEPEKAHKGDVGYRLSWLNTTAEEKTYCVMAAYYNGETLASEQVLQEVKLAAQADGVVTGVAELGENGESMRVYLKEKETPAKDGNLLWIIVGAAAAVVIIAAAVIAVIVIKKKKDPEAPKEA